MKILSSVRVGVRTVRDTFVAILCVFPIAGVLHAQRWSGPVVTTGTLDVTQGILVDGTAQLTGTGVVLLLGSLAGIEGDPAQQAGSTQLTNVDSTITGSGVIGGGTEGEAGLLQFTNQATVLACSTNTIVINPDPNSGVVNTGTFQAASGGYIGFYGASNGSGLTPIDNTAGAILVTGTGITGGPTRAGNNNEASIVEFTSVDLTGGTLSASDGGVLLFDTESVVNNASVSLTGNNSEVNIGFNSFGGTAASYNQSPDVTLSHITLTGDGSPTGQGVWVYGGYQSGLTPTTFNDASFLNGLTVNLVNANVLLTGTLTNTGSLNFDDPAYPTGQQTYLGISGTVTLNGGGTVNFLNIEGSPYNQIDGNRTDPNPGTATLINVNNTITGTGFLGSNPYDGADPDPLMVVNEGTILSGSQQTLIVSPDLNRGLVNTGLIEASSGGYLQLAGNPNNSNPHAPINNSGGSVAASGYQQYLNHFSGNYYDIFSTVELSSVDLTDGTLAATNGGVLLFDAESIVNNAAITLSGNNSQVNVGFNFVDGGNNGYGFQFPNGQSPDITFNNVTFSGDGSPIGQGVWVYGGDQSGLSPTTFNNLSFINGVAVNLVSANVLLSGTLTNTGSLNLDDPNNRSGLPSILAISGSVTLTGGGTVNLLTTGTTPYHVIDGNYNAADVTKNVLINQNNTITGSGFIGGTPLGSGSFSSAMQFDNRGTVDASGTDNITFVAGPTFHSTIPSPIENEGNIELASGALTDVVGDYTQTDTGDLGVELGGTVASSLATLGTPGTYSHLDVSGAASLNGAFQVSLTNGFLPQLGDIYSVLNYNSVSGRFSNYLGLRISSNLVLQPTYGAHSLSLTASTVSPGTTAPLQPVTPGGSLPVAGGSTYAGITSTSNLSTGNDTVATVLDGVASASTSVTIGFQPAGNFAASSGGPLVSDVVNFQGTGTDTFVLQIDYNEAAISAGESETDIFLAWLDPDNNTWENGVLGNTGESTPNQIIGPYDPSTDFVLGDYGVDPVDGRVWAVLDHNSEFGAATAGLQTVPEPSAWALLGMAAAVFALGRRAFRRAA